MAIDEGLLFLVVDAFTLLLAAFATQLGVHGVHVGSTHTTLILMASTFLLKKENLFSLGNGSAPDGAGTAHTIGSAQVGASAIL